MTKTTMIMMMMMMTMTTLSHRSSNYVSRFLLLMLAYYVSISSLNDDNDCREFGPSLFVDALLPHLSPFKHPQLLLLPLRHDSDGAISRYSNADSSIVRAARKSKDRRGRPPLERPNLLLWGATDDDDVVSDSSSPSFPTNNNSVADIQQWLVKKGLSWKQSSLLDVPNMSRVPGCVATVYVRAITTTTTTTTTRSNTDHQNNDHSNDGGRHDTVILYGNSDALVSRGLLCLLSDYLNTLSRQEVLALDPTMIGDVLGVRQALSTGRNDGLTNMLTTIQKQLTLTDDELQKDSTGVNLTLSSETVRGLQLAATNNKATVALLLSGGVDSSVALHLLLRDGYHVVPFYLKIWLEDELAHLGRCPWDEDVTTCRAVCDQAGVHLEILSLQEEYHQRVMQHTLKEAASGRTPNPDILCNSRVKFGCFWDYLDNMTSHRFDYVASGHYAQVVRSARGQQHHRSPVARLYRAPDPVKDQSYFLCKLGQSQLRKLLFPIGHLEKTEVRKLADDLRLPNRNRPDSQGLCFLGKVKFRDFVQIHLGESPGDIVNAFTGEVIGRHQGVWFHTVGQRKGIGPYLKPTAKAFGPWYVVAKDPTKNVVYASNQYDEDVFAQSRSEFHVEDLHWIAGQPPIDLIDSDGSYKLTMKIRHGPKLQTGTLRIIQETNEETLSDGTGGIVQLDSKDGGLAPGQYVVFYTEDAECLGGGIISERHWAKFLLNTPGRNGVHGTTDKTAVTSGIL